MSDELKPCPCCGGEPTWTLTDPAGDPAVQCRACGLEMSGFDAEEAAQDWNRRVEPPALASIRAAVREYHEALDQRRPGIMAQGRAFDKIVTILDMPWRPGEARS